MSLDVSIIVNRLRAHGLLEDAKRIAKEHYTTVDAMLGRSRHPLTTRARHAFWRHVRTVTSMSYPEIGALFDFDHTTVMAGIKKTTGQNRITDARAIMRVI